MLLVGKAVQVIPIHNLTIRTIVIYIGHLITMLPSFIPNGAPPLVSATWFPPNERTTATAIGALAANIGTALAFFIGPTMIPKTNDTNEGNKHNLTDSDVEFIEARLMDYFYVQIGIAAFLFWCVTIYFPSKPPLPPSITQSTRKQTKIGYVEGIRMLVTNWSYWLLIFVFATSFGIYFGWSSVLDLAVQPFQIDEKTSGFLGTSGNSAGIVSGIIIARSADIVKRWTKEILVGLYIGTIIMQLIFTLTCSKILPFSQELLFASIICSGLLFNATIPLLFELIMECVYPVGEGTAAGVGLILGNAVIFVFDAAFMFPMSNVEWMNWVSVGGIAICVPLLLAYKSQYRRLDLDTS